LEEIIARGNEFEIKIFSLKRATNKMGNKVSNALARETYYSPFLLSYELMKSQIHFLSKKPRTYLLLILLIVKHSYKDWITLAKSLIVFPKAVHYARMMRENGIAHIHAHWATIPALTAYLISKLVNINYSITAHAIDIFENETMLEEKLLNAKFVVTCAGYNKGYLIGKFKNLNSRRIFVNYHGIDLEKFRYKEFVNGDPLRIMSVGRIEKSKGYEYLLKSLVVLRKKYLLLECVIVGDGPLEEFIKGLVKKYNLEDAVYLTGAISQEEVIRWYQKSDIFVLCAIRQYHWGIPNVVLESMAMGVPVITTNLPAIGEIIKDGENGILVRERDSEALADAIDKILSSNSLREKLRVNGRKAIEKNFDKEKTISELIGIYGKWI
jgi:glycosyltransferase involved in cell wall biosynthesis